MECETKRDVSRIERHDPTLTKLHYKCLCSECGNREDISFVEESPFLEEVVWSEKLTLFPDLRGSTSLTHLDLRCNRIHELDLEKCGKLKTLTLRNNPIRSLIGSPIENAMEYLDMTHTSITDASALGMVTSLTYLDMTHTSITDASALGMVTSLTYLDLDYTQVEDMTFLSNLKSLTHLDFNRAHVSDASSISHLTNIRHLALSRNHLVRVPTSLGMCHSLTNLDLSFTKIKTVPQLEGTMITQLFLIGNHIEDISFVSGCPFLKILNLSNNNIKDISPLKGNRTIVDLNMVSNDIESIECLRGNTTIEILKIGKNPIESLEPLSENKTIYHFSMVCRYNDYDPTTFELDMTPLLGNTSLMSTYFGYPCSIPKRQRVVIKRLVKLNLFNEPSRRLTLRRLSLTLYREALAPHDTK